MSSANTQPKQHGAVSNEHAPQVVVRADKYFVCSACGVWVEIPADIVGQLVLVADHAAPADPPPPGETTTQSPTHAEPPQETKCEAVAAKPIPQAKQACTQDLSSQPTSQKARPPRPKRPPEPQPGKFTGSLIDGLRVPSAQQLDRAFEWVSFHLQVLDRQGSEIKRLQKLLKQRRRNSTSAKCPAEQGTPATSSASDRRATSKAKATVAEYIDHSPPTPHTQHALPTHQTHEAHKTQERNHSQERGPP